jgi:hypothetical protein
MDARFAFRITAERPQCQDSGPRCQGGVEAQAAARIRVPLGLGGEPASRSRRTAWLETGLSGVYGLNRIGSKNAVKVVAAEFVNGEMNKPWMMT